MKYIFLTSEFYNDYPYKDYPEIEQKQDRPYIMIQISIDGVDFAIPLRSNINHPNVFWTDKPKKCGVDYSKAVPIKDVKYVDSRKPYLRSNEHKALIGKEYLIQKGFEKYIQKYGKALSAYHVDRNRELCQKSTLQYFHEELGIKELCNNN